MHYIAFMQGTQHTPLPIWHAISGRNDLQPGATRAWLSIEEESDELENPWDEDELNPDVCLHNIPLDQWCSACDAESEGI